MIIQNKNRDLNISGIWQPKWPTTFLTSWYTCPCLIPFHKALQLTWVTNRIWMAEEYGWQKNMDGRRDGATSESRSHTACIFHLGLWTVHSAREARLPAMSKLMQAALRRGSYRRNKISCQPVSLASKLPWKRIYQF